jgi:hypothetical protein
MQRDAFIIQHYSSRAINYIETLLSNLRQKNITLNRVRKLSFFGTATFTLHIHSRL